MKLTGIEVLDSTIQRTNGWLRDLMQELNWSDHRKTYLALRCVLHTLRDGMPMEKVVLLGEQLPMLLRGLYYEHWQPEVRTPAVSTREQFLKVLDANLRETSEDGIDAERIARAVFRLLDRKAAEGEIADIQLTLPDGIHDLWHAALRAA